MNILDYEIDKLLAFKYIKVNLVARDNTDLNKRGGGGGGGAPNRKLPPLLHSPPLTIHSRMVYPELLTIEDVKTLSAQNCQESAQNVYF